MPKILLVEDDPVAQDLVKGILESRGWVVHAADDGFASLSMLRERSYAAALVDYHLPEMDGYALARLMRDICQTRQQPMRLIGMTADRHGLAGRRGVDRLFDDILVKPFSPADLLAVLDKVVPQAQPRPAPHRQRRRRRTVPAAIRHGRCPNRYGWPAASPGVRKLTPCQSRPPIKQTRSA